VRRPAFPSNRPTVAACLPKPAQEPPFGPGWIHEIKHDGFRIMARRNGKGVRLYTHNGYNLATLFPRIAAALESLPVESCFIDGGPSWSTNAASPPLTCRDPGATTMPPSCAPSI
jgi:ATP-dependent DNA ligase